MPSVKKDVDTPMPVMTFEVTADCDNFTTPTYVVKNPLLNIHLLA